MTLSAISISSVPNNNVKYDFTILLVDDCPVDLHVTVDALTGLCRLTLATSALEAQQIIEYNALPDLIILDANMPVKNGYELCLELKKQAITKNLPVVILSSNTDVEFKLKGFQHGCVDYLTKPIDKLELYHRVQVYLQHIQQRRDLEMMSFIDPVTGVTNRRTYEFMLQKEWNRSIRYASCVCLLVMDLDDFKAFNSLYGHVEGDRCLRQIAQLLAAFGLRSNDIFARFGGESFVLMLPGCELRGAIAIAERMIQSVRDLKIPHEAMKQPGHLSISIGVAAEYPHPEVEPEHLFEQADDALFMAKHAGKNRFAVSEDSEFQQTKNTNPYLGQAYIHGERARGHMQKRVGDR